MNRIQVPSVGTQQEVTQIRCHRPNRLFPLESYSQRAEVCFPLRERQLTLLRPGWITQQEFLQSAADLRRPFAKTVLRFVELPALAAAQLRFPRIDAKHFPRDLMTLKRRT